MKKLVFEDRAKGDLTKLDRATQVRIAAAIQRLAAVDEGKVKRLQGIDPPEYRLRVGDWRVRFSRPDTETVRINRVLHRKDAYR